MRILTDLQKQPLIIPEEFELVKDIMDIERSVSERLCLAEKDGRVVWQGNNFLPSTD